MHNYSQSVFVPFVNSFRIAFVLSAIAKRKVYKFIVRNISILGIVPSN